MVWYGLALHRAGIYRRRLCFYFRKGKTMHKLPSLYTLQKLNSSDAFQILVRRKAELVQALDFTESSKLKKLIKASLKRVEHHLKALGLN